MKQQLLAAQNLAEQEGDQQELARAAAAVARLTFPSSGAVDTSSRPSAAVAYALIQPLIHTFTHVLTIHPLTCSPSPSVICSVTHLLSHLDTHLLLAQVQSWAISNPSVWYYPCNTSLLCNVGACTTRRAWHTDKLYWVHVCCLANSCMLWMQPAM